MSDSEETIWDPISSLGRVMPPSWLRARFLPVVFLANEEELTGKTFTTSLNTTNPNTYRYMKFIFLWTSPLMRLQSLHPVGGGGGVRDKDIPILHPTKVLPIRVHLLSCLFLPFHHRFQLNVVHYTTIRDCLLQYVQKKYQIGCSLFDSGSLWCLLFDIERKLWWLDF